MLDKDYAKARYRRAHAYAGQEMWDHAVLDMEASWGMGHGAWEPPGAGRACGTARVRGRSALLLLTST